MNSLLKSFFDPWVWKMAWRDTRTYRRRLLLFFSCIAMGVGALVAIRSVGGQLKGAVQTQAKTLLGADLELSSQRPFNESTELLIDSIGGRQSREVRFASMVYFPRVDGTRLIQARAIRGEFPFYGTFRTTPEDARSRRFGSGTALVDAALMIQYDAVVGDTLRLGSSSFEIVGRVDGVSGESVALMDAAPRVFIPFDDLEATRLVQHGSIVSYRVAFELPADTDMESLIAYLHDFGEKNGIRYGTVASRVRRMGRTLDNLYRYLSLSGFAALLLGCVGVASAIHVYIRQKLSTVAVLRCLGARPSQALTVYVIQALGLGALGSLMGAGAGVGLQSVLPYVLSDLLPVDIETGVDLSMMVQGVIVGTGLSLLFALFPLVAVRRVSPLLSLRASYEGTRRPDAAQVVVAGLTLVIVSTLSILQMGGFRNGLGMTAGMLVAFIVLALAAFGLTRLVRRLLPRSWPYLWRQGAANLYRPRNQTHVLVLSLGLGTFLISTLYLMQDSLLNQVALAGGGDRPNIVLFDVQPDQSDAVVKTLESQALPVLHRVPVVTMRLAAIGGEDVQSIMEKESEERPSTWVLTREFRSTYRPFLFDSEVVTDGVWVGQHKMEEGPVPISVGQGLLGSLWAELGDSLTFDVQGVSIECVIASKREIDWQRIQPNFWVVFPGGVLEAAPRFEVVTSRVSSMEASALLQRRLVRQFPNISVIDLGLVLKTTEEVLSGVGFVIRFMASFSVGTGLIVLTAAVISSRNQRTRESVLLRTIGASRKQIYRVLLLEYLFLGSLAGLVGNGLAVGAVWLLSSTVFYMGFSLPGMEVFAVFGIVAILTVVVGAANSRGIMSRPPLEVLRAEY